LNLHRQNLTVIVQNFLLSFFGLFRPLLPILDAIYRRCRIETRFNEEALC
jgi:hypothetical protein